LIVNNIFYLIHTCVLLHKSGSAEADLNDFAHPSSIVYRRSPVFSSPIKRDSDRQKVLFYQSRKAEDTVGHLLADIGGNAPITLP
jgi:hypothetical protein